MAISDLAYIDASGYHYADYPTVLSYYKDQYRSIYGADIYLEPDSQDGQWLAIQAQAIYDCLALAGAVYNSFAPGTAIGVPLSRNVKINGIKRTVATYSVADVVIIGQVGTEIVDGQIEDINGNKWNLPASVVIPLTGTVTVTAVCAVKGSIRAASGSLTKIATPTRGWQSVSNPNDATAGEPVESDAELRAKQKVSTALPSLSVLDGTIGAVANVPGVTRYRGYDNDSNATDADGIPAHNISIVVEGGDVQAIGNAIAIKKTPGTPTYGDVSVNTYDRYGVINVIKFFRPVLPVIGVEITIDALQGYTTGYQDLIKAAVSDSINALAIGSDVLITKLYVPANLAGTQAGTTFDITLIRIKKGAGAFGTVNLPIAFNEAAKCSPADITVIVV